MAVTAALAGGLTACAGIGYTYTADGDATAAVPADTARPSNSPPPSPSRSSVPAIPTATSSPTVWASAKASPSVTSRPKRTATPAPRATPTPKPKPSTSETPKPALETLRVGDRGPEVLALQHRLSSLGYWLGEPDGHYGGLTLQAVWALQKTAGLSRDGTVGPRTQRALDRGVRPRTRLDGNGVDIDLGRQILMIVRGGHVRYILNTSTGGGYEYTRKDGSTATARTPKGTYRVYYSVDGQDEGFLGDMWRPRYFNGGYAVHGSPSIPPYPASHGCARVTNSAMNMIWARDFMPTGSTVLVR